MRRALSFLLLTSAACTGLYLENPNAYPCDFADGPGVRDEVCHPGDICGTDNVCKPFIYEGPRFEGQATLPEYGPQSGEGALLHPLVLDGVVSQVTANLPVTRGPVAYLQQGSNIFEVKGGHVGDATSVLMGPLPPGFGLPTAMQPFYDSPGPGLEVLLASASGRLAVRSGLMTDSVRRGMLPFVATGFRVVDQSPFQAMPVAWNTNELGVVQRAGMNWNFVPWVVDGGTVLDVASVTLPGRAWVLALQPESILVIDATDAGVSSAAAFDAFAAFTVNGGSLKSDPGNRIIAALRHGSTPPVDVLSTFQVNVGAEGPVLTSPWPDCAPCRPTERVELVAPSVRSGVPTVDVVCRRAVGLARTLQVVGSVALTQFDGCLTEELEVPIAFENVALDGGRLVQWDSQDGLLFGGTHGQLWSGETLTSLAPEFLDRVPRDVTPVVLGDTPSLAVIADDYLAIQQTLDPRRPSEQLNGFRRVPARELDGLEFIGFIHGISGWAVVNGGDLVQLTRDADGGTRLSAGAQLVTASEDPIRDSIGGEAFIAQDGGISFFVVADDSLYFLKDPELTLDPEGELTSLTPQLTPEPSVPIRSLALERTPLGTNGTDRARGYLVTSRDVYSWALGGTPARWSSTQLVLAGGEPVEVWFDSARSALGRVGYRDGQIFSLPGGSPLAEALPAGPDGVFPRVLDFENLGGWPVAYASTGLFIAGWDQVDGKLQNRFPNGVTRPMTWREVKLEGDATPWKTQPGKLFVTQEKEGDAGLTRHQLLLFTDDEVREVAHHLRK
ncbi:MAG: hypothetical protein Q8N23_12360 [Archangium sp.]|nr:hypothetical protein [Archangium sp.]MDP3153462.1 hypothetical protein [Archangium sp.]MDP3574698.1 hypothetical protein [Archangium sp.]